MHSGSERLVGLFRDAALIGENGTTYNGDLIDSRMAHIDENGNPGYFSNGWNK